MSVNYAAGLSPCEDKGVCGLQEVFDEVNDIEQKTALLANWIREAKCVTLYCGAGISTAAGIPDFRGPNGVWTLEKKGIKVQTDGASLDDARPTLTHMAVLSLLDAKFFHFIVSQNIDGLFLKANVKRRQIAELHGNFFLDECNVCKTRFIRNKASETMALKVSSNPCPRQNRPCRGSLRDTILDWEDNLPRRELNIATKYSQRSDLSICLGTTLQIMPAGSMPFLAKKKNKGKVAIINLQPTRYDPKADLVIHDYVDNVMVTLAKYLNVNIKTYDTSKDPTKGSESFKPWK